MQPLPGKQWWPCCAAPAPVAPHLSVGVRLFFKQRIYFQRGAGGRFRPVSRSPARRPRPGKHFPSGCRGCLSEELSVRSPCGSPWKCSRLGSLVSSYFTYGCLRCAPLLTRLLGSARKAMVLGRQNLVSLGTAAKANLFCLRTSRCSSARARSNVLRAAALAMGLLRSVSR